TTTTTSPVTASGLRSRRRNARRRWAGAAAVGATRGSSRTVTAPPGSLAHAALQGRSARSQGRTSDPDPWVDDRVQQVHGEVDAEVPGGGHQHDALDHRVAPGEHSVDRPLAEPAQHEDLFGTDRTRDERGDLQPDERP